MRATHPRRHGTGQEPGLWTRFFDIRIVTLALLGIAALLPWAGVTVAVPILLLGVVVPSNLALRHLLLRLRLTPWWMPLLDSTSTVVAMSAEPSIAPIALTLLAGSASIAATSGWRRTVAATAAGTPLLALGLHVAGSEQIFAQIVTYLTVSSGIAVFVSVIADAERAERNRSAQLLDGIDAVIWEARPHPFVDAHVSGNTTGVLGLDPEAVSGPGAWLSRLPAFDRSTVVQESFRAIEAGRDHELTYRVIDGRGTTRHVRDRVRVETDAAGRPVTARGVVVDVTDDVRVRESLHNLAELVERVPVGLVIVEAVDGRYVTRSVNPAYAALVRRAPASLRDQPLDAPLDGPGVTELLGLLDEARRTGMAERRGEARDIRSGSGRVLSMEAFPISERLLGVTITDVSGQVQASRALRHQALHDALTGLPNRALLEDRLRHAIDGARREGRAVALLLADLNQFKEVNDTLGHEQGDLLLTLVAQRLRGELRAVDTVARLGGDEFAVLLSDDVSPRQALRAAQRILSCFDEPHELNGMAIQCGVSLGVAIYPEHGDDADTLRRHADMAMYAAKRRGGGIAVYDPSRDRAGLERLTLVGELRRAIDAEQLRLHYQPVVDLATGRVHRIEALVRWQHPERGLLGPGEFIDIAEVSGVIRPLSRWVIRRGLDDLFRLDGLGYTLGLAANISVRNLYEPAFVDAVRGALEHSGIDGSRLVLELTETQVMDDPLLAQGVLQQLARLGVRGSVDDFGTGHSSLANLQSLPVSEMKVDRSFVFAMGDGDDAAATIVRSIIALGRNLGLEVVAEGVETVETMTRVSMLGCHHAQGYLFSRPLPFDELVGFLERSRDGVVVAEAESA